MTKIYFVLIIVVALFAGQAYSQTADELNKYRIAEALEQAGEYDKALDFYKQLYQIAPNNFVYFDGLRRTYMYLKKYDDVKNLIQSRLKIDPSNVVLLCQLGDAYYKGGTPDSAIAIWDKALTISPTNPNTYRVVADILVKNRLFDKAIEVYKKGESAANSKAMFVTEIARLYFLNMNYRESLNELLKLLQIQDKNSAVAYIQSQLGAYSSSKDAVDQFTNEMVKEIKDNPDNVEYRRLLSFLYMEQKNYPAAYETYKWLDTRSGSNGTELLAFADRAYNDEAYDVAANAYREVSDLAKDNSVVVKALMGYANSLRRLGEKDYTGDDRPCAVDDTLKYLNASLSVYERVIKEFSNMQYLSGAVLNAVEIKMKYFHDFGGAEKLLSKFGNFLPMYRYEGTLTRIQLYMMEGKFNDALSTALGVVQSGTQVNNSLYDRIQYQAGLALYYLGMYDSSTYYLKKITTNPMSDAANDALQLLNLITDNSGNPEALREFASAGAMEASNRLPEAAAMLEEILKNYPQVALADNARLDLASAYCKMGKVQEALKYYSELAEDSTGIFADRAQFRIGIIYQETLHQKDKAVDEYEDFLMRFPNSIYQDKVRAIIRDLLSEKL